MTKPVMDPREVVEKIGDAELLREMMALMDQGYDPEELERYQRGQGGR